jgi:ABC-2 type transport system permease protein
MPPRSWPGNLVLPLGWLRGYLGILRISLVDRLAYRGEFFLGGMLRFFPLLGTVLLWKAVYAGMPDGSPDAAMAGFAEHEMIAYLLLIHVSLLFSSMPGVALGIARDIRDGSLKKFLTQPIDLLGYVLAVRVAHKVVHLGTSFGSYALLLLLCVGSLGRFPDLLTLSAWFVSLLLGFLIGFACEALVGLLGFWFLDVTALVWVFQTLNYFVSGQLFPLDLVRGWAPWLELLPFQYLAWFPAVIFLGRVRGGDLARGLVVQALWALLLFLLARWLLARGLRHYSSYGG